MTNLYRLVTPKVPSTVCVFELVSILVSLPIVVGVVHCPQVVMVVPAPMLSAPLMVDFPPMVATFPKVLTMNLVPVRKLLSKAYFHTVWYSITVGSSIYIQSFKQP